MKFCGLILGVCFAVGSAWADDVVVVLDSVAITAAPGNQITFGGIIFNNGLSTVDLNGISISLNGMFTVDTTPFFSGPLTVSAPGPFSFPQTGDFSMFNVTVNSPYTDPDGLNMGTLTILGNVEGSGGYDPTIENSLGSTQFFVAVVTTPEPSAFLLILLGTALLVLFQAYGPAKNGKNKTSVCTNSRKRTN